MIGVIDYKAGNSPSVLNALKQLDIPGKLVTTRDEISALSGIILPGVGEAQATMSSLQELEILDVLEKKVLSEKTPFFGICVGLQVLFEHSEEGDTDCLGWVKGVVKRYAGDLNIRVPQIGWNEVVFNADTSDVPVLSGLNISEYFYFVNSYFVIPENKDIVFATTDYGIKFCSMIKQDNIYATQFHIEKSGTVGLKLLRNFAGICKRH